MKQIIRFLIVALKWLAKPIRNFKSPEEKYVPLKEALSYVEMAAHQWMYLHSKYKDLTNVKRSGPLLAIDQKIKSEMQEYDELKGFSLFTGSPFIFLARAMALDREGVIVKYGEMCPVIEIGLLERLVLVIITYNFFKKYKDRLTDLFEKAETDMRDLVEQYRLPGRFSWNAFVEKVEKEKKESDFSVLDEYKDAPMPRDEGNTADSDEEPEPPIDKDGPLV